MPSLAKHMMECPFTSVNETTKLMVEMSAVLPYKRLQKDHRDQTYKFMLGSKIAEL